MKAGRTSRSSKSSANQPLKAQRFDYDNEGSAHIKPLLLQVYDLYRTSLLNVKYYGYKLKWARRAKISMDIAIGISTAGGVSAWTISSGLAGWVFWSTYLWPVVTGGGALLFAIKPYLPLRQKAASYSRLYTGYTRVYLGLKTIVDRITVEHGFSRNMEREYESLARRLRTLAAQDGVVPRKTLIKKFQDEVEIQIPSDSFWWPK